LIGSDLVEGSAIGKSQLKESSVRCIEYPQAIAAGLNLVKGLYAAIHDHGVADDLVHPGMLRIGRNGVKQLPLSIEDAVVQHQRQLKAAGRQIQLLLVGIAKQIDARQAGIEIEPAGAHGVVVIPEHGCILAVGVMAYMRLTAWVPMLGIAVIDGGGSAAMKVNHSTRLRQFAAGAVQAVIDGEEVPGRQLIGPLDYQFFVAAGFEQRADGVRSIAPQAGRGKITVHPYLDLAHGDAEMAAWERRPLGKKQRIDKGFELEGVDGAGCFRRVGALVDAARERREMGNRA
jgi:hypothetical protein